MGHHGPITVFGGTGFLGRRIAATLTGAGLPVRVVARRTGRDLPPGVEQVPGDIRRPDSIREALGGAAAAINAVALYVEGRDARFEDVHHEGARRLAQSCHETGVRLVHVSGIGADPGSASPYVAARGRGERAVRESAPGVAILRPSVIFGPGDAFVSTLAGVTRLPAVPLFGDGSVRLQPVHVDDVAAAIRALVSGDAVSDTVLELGGADVLTYREVLQAVMEAAGRRRPLIPVPLAFWHLAARGSAFLPSPPLTRDQVVLMSSDNVARPPGFQALGIEPRGLRAALPECLAHGR